MYPMSADAWYGPDPTKAQPTASPIPDHVAYGGPEPIMHTGATGVKAGPHHSPILVLVVIIGLALLLVQVSLRGEVKVEA